MKKYTAWTQWGKGQEMMAERECKSAKEFKRLVEESGAKVTSRIRVKKHS